MKITNPLLYSTAITALCLCGCKSDSTRTTVPDSYAYGVGAVKAQASLSPASGSNARGTVTFIQEKDGVRVKAALTGLTPGQHGFHIHENGDCSAPDASSAGGHFNPTGMPHGAPGMSHRHVGDFGNIEADASGMATYSKVYSDLTFEGESSIIGRAIIIHAKADDLKTQPTGDAGGRVACGVISKQ